MSQLAQPSRPILETEVRNLPCSNPRDDPNASPVRGKRWTRPFELHLLAKGISSDQQKVALLLHAAGTEQQDLNYMHATAEEELKDVIKMLDDYFLQEINVPFERHMFSHLGSRKEGKWISSCAG